MSTDWDTFTKYRDGFNENIYYNDKRGHVLNTLLDKFPDHQVVAAQQVADWADTTTKKLNSNNIWKLFPRYGLIALVQKIDHTTHSNRLLVAPIFRWLKQWDGTPSMAPTDDDYISEHSATQEELTKRQAREATELLSYIIAHLDAPTVPDPKEAILWAKVAASDAVTAQAPSASVTMQKIDSEGTEHPPSYEGLKISGTLSGSEFEIIDRDHAERVARSVIYLFALAGCYNQKAAKANAAEDDDYAPAPVTTDNETLQNEDQRSEDAHQQPKGPYLIKKQELILESEPPTFSVPDDKQALTFDFQLGPLWTRYTEEQ